MLCLYGEERLLWDIKRERRSSYVRKKLYKTPLEQTLDRVSKEPKLDNTVINISPVESNYL